MSWRITPGWSPADADAAAYIAAVEQADGQALENGVKVAIDNFVLGCKADGIWSAIKASCILAGARTLNGALVPLVGTAPTNFNFVSGDYNRKTGLKGDGSTKRLDSNRANNADPRDSKHVSVYVTEALTTSSNLAALGSSGSAIQGRTIFVHRPSEYQYSINTNAAFPVVSIPATPHFAGASRSSSNLVECVVGTASGTDSGASQSPSTDNISIFSITAPAPGLFASGRIAFYSIGENLNLTLLRARVTTLINALGAAIP